MDSVYAWNQADSRILHLYKPEILSLPNNGDLKSLLTSLSTELTNKYLVTKIIECPPDPLKPGSNTTTPLYSISKPFVWHRLNESASSISKKRSGDEL